MGTQEGGELQVDLLVIGFGKGGKTLAAAMGRRGTRVAVVEQSASMYGGTCINIGCVPTKALVHRAERKDPGTPGADRYGTAVQEVADLTSLLRERNFAMLDTIDSVIVVTGRAAFLDSKSVEVVAGDDRLVILAETIVVNTGAEPVVPGIPGLDASRRVLTSTDLLAVSELPASLAVLGGGYVGTEYASIYAQFGAKVTVLDRAERLMTREDDDVVAAATGILRDHGVNLQLESRITGVRDLEGAVEISYVGKDGIEGSLTADIALVALGRAPATAGLNLTAAGVDVDDRGAVVVDEHLRTSQPHIFAIGDVNGGPQFTYISLDDYRIVLDQLTGPGRRTTLDRKAVPYAIFMSPPLARVGMTERQARTAGHEVLIAVKPIALIAAMPRARILGETRGLMKFVVDAVSDQVLGAALLNVDSQELINTVALAMRAGVSATELRDAIYTHPSSTEAFNEVLGALV